MKTVIEMAKAAGLFTHKEVQPEIERFAELVRADERNSWPTEMEAMERQVNILTDALNDRQRWFDALEAQHKQAILAEREACAKVCDDLHPGLATKRAAEIIRARSKT